MKKYVTFSNFLAVLGIMTILFYLIPAVHISTSGDVYTTNVNLFKATFGGSFSIDFAGKVNSYSLVASGGLIVGFILGIVGIILTILKNKFRIATLFAFPFFITAGVLVACAAPLVNSVNFSHNQMFGYSNIGGAITVATFWCIIGALALIDFIATIAKPKQQNAAI